MYSAARSERLLPPPLSASDVAGGVLARLRTVVESAPDAVAVVDAESAMTFGDLAARAGSVADALHDAAEPGQPVAMLCGHDAQAVATVLGAVLSGRPLLVLDPLTPVPRLRGFLERLGARVCLADAARLEVAARTVEGIGTVLRSPAQTPGADWAGAQVWRRPLDPAAVAVLGFTSGSTGNPKVVALDHRHLVGDAWAGSAADDCVRADDVMAHTLPMAFAAGMNATLTGVLSGATTALYDVRPRGIAGLAPWIEQTEVTVLHASPAILRAITATGPAPEQLATLRSLTTAGEAAHGRDVAAARRLLPRACTVFHRLGSTETGLIAQYTLGPGTPTPDGPLPVGRPIGLTRVDLVDEDGAPVPAGEPGTLRVTRSYLATGYWQDPERSAESFADNPDGTRSFLGRDIARLDDDGQLRLLGRRDHSVKIRGYMVEPGDVDAVLFARPDVREAVTVGRPRAGDQVMHLVSYVVPAAEQVSPAALRAAVGESLPSYMVPQRIVLLEALPRTDRGKVDRSSLPEPVEVAAGSTDQAFSSWERVVADLWARVLFLDHVGPDDDFFELGGDSLAAEALVSAMTGDLGVPAAKATTSLLAEAPTVRRFAARLTREPPAEDTLVPIQTEGEAQTLFVVAGGGGLGVAFLRLARRLGPDQRVWALQAHGMERRGVPDWSVRAIARRNVAAVRSVQPHGPYHLAGHSFGGLVAFEMAHQLRRAGHEVGQLVVLDSFPPDPSLQPTESEAGPQSLLARAKAALGLALTGIRGAPGEDQYWRFYRLSGVLARRYRSQPWPGDTVVVLADSPERDERSRWADHLSGIWRTVSVAGDHLSMIREPYVEETAEVVAEALREWRLRHQSAVERERAEPRTR